MRSRRFGALAALAVLAASCGAPPSARPSALVIRNVTVIDGTDGPPIVGATVVIEGGRISRIDREGSGGALPRTRTVDGTGKFLIPGLWDMHVHTSYDRGFTMPLLIANGVTGVREMFGRDVTSILGTRREIESGRLLGPRIVTAGPIVDGPSPAWPARSP
ncbi:MAG: hypothetical protein R2909_03595 [Gemmatimonadales bacterium]